MRKRENGNRKGGYGVYTAMIMLACLRTLVFVPHVSSPRVVWHFVRMSFVVRDWIGGWKNAFGYRWTGSGFGILAKICARARAKFFFLFECVAAKRERKNPVATGYTVVRLCKQCVYEGAFWEAVIA